MKSGKKTVIFCDFDGTITLSDNIVAIMKEFKPEGYEAIMQRTVNQEISLREASVPCLPSSLPAKRQKSWISSCAAPASAKVFASFSAT
ncbi:2-hydroxy-3-keto-5-methylthiopentenyl-1-phosphate phosphatase [Paenibacillus sp. P1XP2]|nr:2-hydroxy-3-keto-5-methylthiopentenyl-1-phosphate phosphatase [Paenibacillus sp. P1XP2]